MTTSKGKRWYLRLHLLELSYLFSQFIFGVLRQGLSLSESQKALVVLEPAM